MSPNWVETQELLTATFEQPAGDRERFVRENCVDPVLRDTIAALVKPSTPADVPAITSETATDLPSGTRVGPYVILHRLGRGGMGEVFLGRDPRLDRFVALKCLITSSSGSGDLRARVIREARAAARISHTNVAAVYDVVEHEGRAFIVMEYVEGESLAVLLKRGSLSPARVIAIGRQIAAALAAAHGNGIVHRDLKPANIQVTADGSIKILDFGIATALASLTTTRASTTTEVGDIRGQQVGTPAYMSPEQLLGRPVDERSDLFSLALILFEMTTGRRVFPTNDPLAVLLAAVRKLPRADDIDSQVPSQLADVIGKGLAADPADRFQSAVEMAGALDAVREELYSTPRQPRAPAAASSRTRGRFTGFAIAAACAPLIMWFLGRLGSAAFNITLGRFDAFAAEPWQVHFVLGGRSVVAPLVYATLAMIALWVVRFLLRVLALTSPVARTLDTVTGRWNALAARLNLNEPIVLAQALVTAGAIAITVVVLRFGTLITAWTEKISIAPPELLARLSPANGPEKVLYRAALTVLFLIFTAGLVRVLSLRARLGTRNGKGPLAALAIIVAVLLLLNEVPYRILWKSDAMRSEYEGARCYVIGQNDTQALLFCPDNAPPRTKVIQKNDSRFRSTGVVENIFTTRK
jgi:predicted Ser/Thr protein kinase